MQFRFSGHIRNGNYYGKGKTEIPFRYFQSTLKLSDGIPS
ncbi:hypothetical protein LEP1GSC058_0912 [Leptospira fainei serovar Hurstbridge str. BUT 6]|uniref:Uncharacterized protein n=1 Tax=Leptospira fainei serovar Hurstbridge str. BUT 6 TaxID=1193011 RepID=S3UQQ2_9LEPT|nr:hypothetical protein LEP1GSC058_0912 [Leptospira fainei serovar Hurstbridge str. BUT 6]